MRVLIFERCANELTFLEICVSIDILLHQSGHIMLSDFDLAKQSNDPHGMPTMVHSETNGVSSAGQISYCSLNLIVS